MQTVQRTGSGSPLTATKDDIDDGGVVLYAAITVARDQRAS